MTRFKICGLRQADHAVSVADSGADFLGFNFVPGARRRLTPDQAASIIADYRRLRGDAGPRLVGLFADQPLDDVNRVARACGLDYVQLCGDEPTEYWAEVALPIIRQIKVRDEGSSERSVQAAVVRVDQVASRGHIPLLDRYEPGALGGTGLSFDWDIAREVSSRYDVMLAGGLTAANVGKAIDRVSPWGVDVSSGVETAGIKDPERIAAFAASVARADARRP